MSAGSVPWPAPAKLNLLLRIVGRRADGYHLLQTVFQFLDRCDELHFAVREDGAILREGEGPAGVAAEQDLSVRAARLLQQETGTRLGAAIRIRKRLPLGGGLGGGSSDAATTLVALNHYWGCGLSLDELATLGLRLGADVPVFVRGRAAWGEGVGEQLTPLELPQPWYVVLVPDCHVVTAAVFQDPELTRDSEPITIRDFLAGSRENDCAAVVFRRYPSVAEAARWLAQFGEARLTGTGACVFAAFADNAEAQRVLARLPSGWAGFRARGLNHSPLHQRLGLEHETQVTGP
ncbi:MAG TPA: 4-(cytidine 5'-diphospho)-2-C-methyl-D-erythritol kinase [Candidatus Competibacteraceae bacterium]|nr:4-(cytidine 5'-diphospho)-2-C-methyl-D-erythritol kinase [Candidatus Competibacteraceae bacterium]